MVDKSTNNPCIEYKGCLSCSRGKQSRSQRIRSHKVKRVDNQAKYLCIEYKGHSSHDQWSLSIVKMQWPRKLKKVTAEVKWQLNKAKVNMDVASGGAVERTKDRCINTNNPGRFRH